MRLHAVQEGHALPFRLVIGLFRRIYGDEAPDVVRTFWYRPLLFGLPFTDLLHAAMRGPSHWTAGERELFAAHTAKLNQCVF